MTSVWAFAKERAVSGRLEGEVLSTGGSARSVEMTVLPFALFAQPDARLLGLLTVRHTCLVNVLRQTHVGNASYQIGKGKPMLVVRK